MTVKKSLLAFVFISLFSASVLAAPITYTFAGNWLMTNDLGATYVSTVTFDNGGKNAANQVFTQADFVSANVTAGPLNHTMGPADITSWSINFTSNGNGELYGGWFNAGLPGNEHYWSYNLSDYQNVRISFQDKYGWGFETNISAPVESPSLASVPTMTTYGLVLAVFGFLLLASRRLLATSRRR